MRSNSESIFELFILIINISFPFSAYLMSFILFWLQLQIDPSYRPSLSSRDGNGASVPPFAASDLILSPSQWSSRVVGIELSLHWLANLLQDCCEQYRM